MLALLVSKYYRTYGGSISTLINFFSHSHF